MTSVLKVSSSLARIIGSSSSTRPDGLKKVWDYIRVNKLQNPTNKREILPNAELRSVMNSDVVKFTEVLKYISPHFEKDPNAPKVPRVMKPRVKKPQKEFTTTKVAAKPKKDAAN